MAATTLTADEFTRAVDEAQAEWSSAIRSLPIEEWGLIEVRQHDHESPCDQCGTPAKRLLLLEDFTSGRRIWVGRNCANLMITNPR